MEGPGTQALARARVPEDGAVPGIDGIPLTAGAAWQRAGRQLAPGMARGEHCTAKRPPMNVSEVLCRLEALADPYIVDNKARRFGIVAHNALGVNQQALNLLAREIGTDNELAVALFDTGLYEARLLCSKLFDPGELSVELMERWASGFENWEICDSFCMGFFARSTLARSPMNWE